MTWRATSGRHYRLRLGVRVVVVVRRVHDVVRALRHPLPRLRHKLGHVQRAGHVRQDGQHRRARRLRGIAGCIG